MGLYEETDIDEIRSFNRYYTNILGLLDRHVLNSPYSLTEGRILLEIAQMGGCTVTALADAFHLNIGYLSRTLSALQSLGLIEKQTSDTDSRSKILRLTDCGLEQADFLNRKSDEQIAGIIAPLSKEQGTELVHCMKRIRELLAQTASGVTAARRNDYENVKIVEGSPYIEEIKLLITEYTKFLNRDLAFQHLQGELADLKIKYTKPNGELFAAVVETGEVAGCVAFYRHSDVRCEMKRLYVKPEFRKANLGRRLIEAIIGAARQDGYQEMVLDTIRPLKSAIHLYREYGFQEIPAYYHNPMEDVVYMKLDL